MREGWEEAQLGAVCQLIKRGIAPKYLDSGGVCVINQKCIRDHAINFSLARRHDAAAKRVPAERYIQYGDVLVNSTGTGTLGRVAQVRVQPKEPTAVDTHVTIVRPKDGLFVPEFFGYMLVKIEEEIMSSGEGASGQTELARMKLQDQFSVSYPRSNREQKRIVAILDEAFAGIDTAIANTEKNLANAKKIFCAVRDSTFATCPASWRETQLGDICSIKHGFAFKSQYFSKQGSHVVLTPGSFWEQGGFRDQGAKTKFYIGDIPADFVLSKDDFLIAMTEQAAGLLGSSLIVPESARYLHNQRLGLVRVTERIDWYNDFFFHQFNTREFRAAVQATASGVKVRHTSPNKLGAIKVRIPPAMPEQVAVADKLNGLNEESQLLVQIYQKKLTALNELKQSLLHKAFSGELTAAKLEREVDHALA